MRIPLAQSLAQLQASSSSFENSHWNPLAPGINLINPIILLKKKEWILGLDGSLYCAAFGYESIVFWKRFNAKPTIAFTYQTKEGLLVAFKLRSDHSHAALFKIGWFPCVQVISNGKCIRFVSGRWSLPYVNVGVRIELTFKLIWSLEDPSWTRIFKLNFCYNSKIQIKMFAHFF